MGGWLYQYVVPFPEDAQAALDALRAAAVAYEGVPVSPVFVGY